MFKNTASQKWRVYAFDATDNTPVTGDAAQITAKIDIDHAGAGAVTDTNPTETEDGYYLFDLTQGETNGDVLDLYPESSTGDVQVIGVPGTIYTDPPSFPDLTIASNRVNADTVAVSGDTTAADNLESQYDTTGLTGDTFPSTQAAVGNLTSGSAAIGVNAESFTKAGAEPETNSYTATVSLDETYHIVEDDATSTDVYYQFDVGGNGVPVTATWWGYAQSQGDSYTVWAYNYGTTTYEQIGTLNGLAGTTRIEREFKFTVSHVGTAGADLGKVRLRFLSADGTAIATDRVVCNKSVVAQSVGYADGAIWIDSGGTAGAEAYVNGTADNPCPWANAKTLNTALGLNRFRIANGDTLTLDTTVDNWSFAGDNWTLALGNQSIEGASFEGAHVTGIATATVTQPQFIHCQLGAVTLPPSLIESCGIGENSGQFTAGSDGQYVFEDCLSLVPGSGSPAFDFSGLGAATGINNRRWAGGSTYTLDSDCTLSHEVLAGGGQTFTTGGADVEVRGISRAITLVLSGAGTVQCTGVTGPITISGTATTTVNLFGVSASISDTSINTTVNDWTVNQANINTEVDTGLADYAPNTVVPDAAGTAAGLHGTTDGLIGALKDFDAANDTVARVTLVDTVTANADLVSAADVDTVLTASHGAGAWTTGAGGDATEAKQDIITTHLTDIKGGTWSDTTDTLEDIRDAVDTLVPGSAVNVSGKATLISGETT